MSRPMHYEDKPDGDIKAYTGTKLHCKNWDAEAALRMLMNNLDPQVAINPGELIVYKHFKTMKHFASNRENQFI